MQVVAGDPLIDDAGRRRSSLGLAAGLRKSRGGTKARFRQADSRS